MLRESIGGILAGIGVLFAVATSIAAGFAISSWDFYWYYQSGQGMEERYSWDGRQLYQVEAGTGRTNFVQFESWSQLGYEALPALYATTQSLMVASICFSGLAVLAFLAVGFLRWFYRYQVVHLEPADKPRRTGRFRNEEERQQRQTHRQEDDDGDYDDDDDDDDEDKEYRVKPTYRSWRKNAIIRYFADRDRHGWSLLISEWVSVIFALLSLALLIAAVAVFASQHADKMKSDLSLNGCLSPGPCESLAGDEGLSSSVLVRSWRPGVGWAWATATLAFAAGSLLVAVAQFTVRNNRFMSEDVLQRDVDLERADPQGFFFSEYELLSQSHVWQGQEKAFHKQDGWYQPLVDPHPFPASEQSISHQYREDP